MKFQDWKLLKLLGLNCKKKVYRLEEEFKAKVIEVFPFPGGDGFIVSFQVGLKNQPLIGHYVEFHNGDIWKVEGIMFAAINIQGMELLENKRKLGMWDLRLKAVINKQQKPFVGPVRFSKKLPPSIILNQN
ncbi:MAG: hypothetical protein KA341_07705 [Saprospiraceae bacterium]|jgi:hypothetical protein|nr:hypothetical protein [Saprospiraceae bacterium]